MYKFFFDQTSNLKGLVFFLELLLFFYLGLGYRGIINILSPHL